MDAELEALCADVEEMITFLRGRQLRGWADVYEKAVGEIKDSDFHGVLRILSGNGGKGTMNDMFFRDDEGYYDTLKSRIFTRAEKIYSSLDFVPRPNFNPVKI